MKPTLFDQCRAYLLAHATPPSPPTLRPPALAVTISRETGTGAREVGKLVAELLQKRQRAPGYPWAVIDQDIIKKVIEQEGLPAKLERYMPEDATGRVQDVLEDVLNLHPPTSALVGCTTRTILRLALIGNVVLIGRAANVITAMLDHVLHVRLIAPLDARVRHAALTLGLDPDEARTHVARGDRARARYVRRYYGTDVRDPLQYHLAINTGRVAFLEAARVIADAAWMRQRAEPARNSERPAGATR